MSIVDWSLVRDGPRKRMLKSEVENHSLEKAAEEWLTKIGDRRAASKLDYYYKFWSWKAQPPPNEMCQITPLTLAEIFVQVVPDLNPGLVQLQAAIVANHNDNASKKCLFSGTPCVESRLVAGSIRKILSRFREVKRHPDKLRSLLKKATSKERYLILGIVAQIKLDSGSTSLESRSSGSLDIVPSQEGGPSTGSIDSDIDDELAQLGTVIDRSGGTHPTSSEFDIDDELAQLANPIVRYEATPPIGTSPSLLPAPPGRRNVDAHALVAVAVPTSQHEDRELRPTTSDELEEIERSCQRRRVLQRSLTDDLMDIENAKVDLVRGAVACDIADIRSMAATPLPTGKGKLSRDCTTEKKESEGKESSITDSKIKGRSWEECKSKKEYQSKS
jgi:hypothetical protein